MPDLTFRQGQISFSALSDALRQHAPRGRDIAWVGHIAHTAEFEAMTVVGLTPDKHAALLAALQAGGATIVDHPNGEVGPGGEVVPTDAELAVARAADHIGTPRAATGNGAAGGADAVHARGAGGSGAHAAGARLAFAARERAVATAAAAIIVASIIKIAA